MNCENCHEKKRADYWFGVSTILFSVIGGVIGAVIAYGITKLPIW